jgi:hypothetical protein
MVASHGQWMDRSRSGLCDSLRPGRERGCAGTLFALSLVGSEVPRGRVRPNLELGAVLLPGVSGTGGRFWDGAGTGLARIVHEAVAAPGGRGR